MDRPIALVTGVGRKAGIAAAIAQKLAANNWDLVLTYWTNYDQRMPWGVQPDDPLMMKAELESSDARVVLLEADLERPESAQQIFCAAAQGRRRISALVLCHCESVDSGILDTTVESFNLHLAVNARASWQLIQEFARQIPKEGGVWYRGPFEHNGSVATLEDWFDPNRLRSDYVPTGFVGYGVKTRAVKGHEFGRKLTPADKAALIAFLKTL